jgi:hypothetical protein
LNGVQRHVRFITVVRNAVCRLWRQAKQALDGAAGSRACTKFQYLPQQHQRCDYRCCFKIDRKVSNGEERDCAVNVSGGHTDADQREHIEVSTDDGFPSAFQQWQPGIKHGYGCE